MTARPDLPRPVPDGRRRGAIVAAGVALVAIAAVAAFALGGVGGSGGGTPSAPGGEPGVTSAYADLSLVPVIPSGTPAGTLQPSGSPVAAGTATPSASPTASAAGEVKATRIRIERLDINLRIIEGDGIDAPIGKVAHYPGTAWPGGGSNIYIYGHAREGMFLSLWEARVGDVVELDLVDGTKRAYLVDRVLPKVPWDAVKYLRPTETEQLTLQTSTSYHPTSPRFIVIAHPAP
ncbi:MAG: sortase [Chloroflexota bacterium]